jgi:molybdopterin synthase catalytic subunit
MQYVTRRPIDVHALLSQVADPALGGTAMFLGSVRRGEDDGPVDAIDYSAYQDMVETEFAKIVEEAAAQWPGVRVVGAHRIGLVPAGEPSIAVVAAAPHRAEAFAACRHTIEEAKKRLPVWKKEIFTDGTEAWRNNDQPERDAEPTPS